MRGVGALPWDVRILMKTLFWLIVIVLIAAAVWYWMGNHTIQIILPWVP